LQLLVLVAARKDSCWSLGGFAKGDFALFAGWRFLYENYRGLNQIDIGWRCLKLGRATALEENPRRRVVFSDSGNSMDESDGWLKTPVGKVVAVLLCLAAAGVAAAEIRAYLHGDTPGDPNTAMYVDADSGKAFPHKMTVGEMIPVISPLSGKQTGYPGVPCYWTASGEIKKDPTWVLMNSWVGKLGPTFCPDCGRLVNPLLPRPSPGDKPPPTRDELLHSNPAALDGQPSGR
jgi:hypothetical protein